MNAVAEANDEELASALDSGREGEPRRANRNCNLQVHCSLPRLRDLRAPQLPSRLLHNRRTYLLTIFSSTFTPVSKGISQK